MFNRLVGCEDCQGCARLTSAEPHPKETSHRPKAITSSDPRRRYTLRPNRCVGPRKVPHGLNACVASSAQQPVPASQFGRHDLPPSLEWVSGPNSALPSNSDPGPRYRPERSSWRLARSSCPRSCNTSALARRANRCAAIHRASMRPRRNIRSAGNIKSQNKRVFLDYKYYDISETVKNAVARAASMRLSTF